MKILVVDDEAKAGNSLPQGHRPGSRAVSKPCVCRRIPGGRALRDERHADGAVIKNLEMHEYLNVGMGVVNMAQRRK